MSTLNIVAAESTPPLSLQNISRVQTLCLVAPVERPDAQALQDELCETVTEIAGKGAPVSVKQIAFGDPALLDRTALTLLVHAGVEAGNDGRLVAIYVRPFRGGGSDTETFFVARPRAVRLAVTGPGGASLRSALTASLSEILPWVKP